jgi:transcriptional regulator with PAS, ATPase and Fis domain
MNRTLLEALHLNSLSVIGRYILDVIPNSKLPEILATGRTDKTDIWSIAPGREVIVDRMPIKKDGEIIGAIAHTVIMDIVGSEISDSAFAGHPAGTKHLQRCGLLDL